MRPARGILTITLNPSLDEWVYLPRLTLGALNRGTQFTRYPGGKGINVSRVVQELGGATLALALAGGEDGRILHALLTQERLPHDLVPVPGTTRNNYHLQTTSPRRLTQINSPGPRVPVRALRDIATRIRQIGHAPSAIVCSGSLPPGLPSTTYRAILRQAPATSLTVLDSSGRALYYGLTARPWLVKPNRLEAEELLGRRLTTPRAVVRAACALTARGPRFVLMSLGPDGAVLADGRTAWFAMAPPVRVHSGVGAGDSMVAGFVTAWLRSQSPTEALRWGVACGTAAVTTPGTELCHRPMVTRLLPKVRIRRIPGAS